MDKSNAKLILIGAGPGDPELITIKATKKLAEADVVLYDALVHSSLLDYSNDRAEKIFVGKRAGSPENRQENINRMILKHLSNGRCVVRLKGGDPFIFGRGHEELALAKEHGFDVEVVPGISSSTSLSALQHIPLTKRGINESFWVITAVTRDGSLSRDLEHAARSTATVVVMMGIARIAEIAGVFQQHRRLDTPVAVIQKGSWSDEKIALGTLQNIEDVVHQKKIGSPALILIGDVAGLHPDFKK